MRISSPEDLRLTHESIGLGGRDVPVAFPYQPPPPTNPDAGPTENTREGEKNIYIYIKNFRSKMNEPNEEEKIKQNKYKEEIIIKVIIQPLQLFNWNLEENVFNESTHYGLIPRLDCN